MKDRVATFHHIIKVASCQVQGQEVEIIPSPSGLKVCELFASPIVVVEAIHTNNFATSFERPFAQMGSDESCASGHEGASWGWL